MFRNVRKEEITIPAQMSYMGQVRDYIEHIGSKYKYSDKIINSYKLVIEEACTNIIRHGYRDIKGGEISLKAIIRQQSLTIVIIDQGISYDPRQAQTPDLEKYIQIGKKGGLGIFMMRKLMDDVQYNITSRGNELRLTKQRENIDIARLRSTWESLSLRTRYTIGASVILSTLAILTFFFFYSKVDQNILEDTIEYTRGQTLSMADNSRELLQDKNDLDLFAIAQAFKANNPGLIYETFIVDRDSKIIASSTPLKAIGTYSLPQSYETIEDTLGYFRILYYTRDDTVKIYDFSADVYAGLRDESPMVGAAHIWVSQAFIENKADREKLNIIIFVFILLLISYVGIYFLIDRIVTPFHSLADWVRQVGQGTIDEDEIDIDASDELGEIAQAFNLMTSQFREAQVSVIEQQRLQKELQVAQEIQQMLLPSDFPLVKGYELASFYEAAKEVGGDLFDFVEVDADTLGICIADVAGKGIPGSLIMTMIRTALRLEARGNKNPADVLSRVNRFVTDDMKRGMFVTMFYLVLDSRNRIIHYASAGHNPMILYRGSTKQTYFLNPSGFPVGIQLPDISLFDQKIEQDSIRLREDDLLVLYTDGITEAMNPKRDLYREERFLDAVRKNSHYEVAEFINKVKEDIKAFTQGYQQNDDITFVAVKEKLMHGEVLFAIQKELFEMIEIEKIKVKDACEKMQVSPYTYRKYKKVKDTVGLEGLKELLYNSDYIEKKHLSIELKTRVYDVIGNHPDFGAKGISNELNTEKYNFTKLDSARIYNELVKAKLNTKEKRERYIKRGGKKHIKPPGTPLMTLDGQVILDYESVEKALGTAGGGRALRDLTASLPPSPDRKIVERQLSSRPKGETIEEKDKPPVDKKTEKPEESRVVPEEKIAAKPAVEGPAKPSASEPVKPELPKDVKPEEVRAEPAKEEKKKAIQTEKKYEPQQLKKIPEKATPEAKPEAAQKEPEKPAEASLKETTEATVVSEGDFKKLQSEKEAVLRQLEIEKKKIQSLLKTRQQSLEQQKENRESALPGVPSGKHQVQDFEAPDDAKFAQNIEKFYNSISGDIEQIRLITVEWDAAGYKPIDLLKIGKVLGVITTNPQFKSLGRASQLFIQVIRYLEFLETHAGQFETKFIVQNTKDMLKYIEKENILSNSNTIVEQINELGIKNHQLKAKADVKKPGTQSQLETIRRKIAEKNMMRNG